MQECIFFKSYIGLMQNAALTDLGARVSELRKESLNRAQILPLTPDISEVTLLRDCCSKCGIIRLL